MSKFLFSFPSTELSLKVSNEIFGILIDNLNIDKNEKYRLKIVVSELFANAFVHGNRSDPAKYIDVVIDINNQEFVAIVKDQGTGVTPEKLKILGVALPEPLSEHGRGINIAQKYGDNVDLYKDPDGRFCIRFARKLNNIKKEASDVVGG
jgi:anti-sigma regulatory factor (Ser/Thr protein kinase)